MLAEVKVLSKSGCSIHHCVETKAELSLETFSLWHKYNFLFPSQVVKDRTICAGK